MLDLQQSDSRVTNAVRYAYAFRSFNTTFTFSRKIPMAVYVIYEDNNESIDVCECVNDISCSTTVSRVYDPGSEITSRNVALEILNVN